MTAKKKNTTKSTAPSKKPKSGVSAANSTETVKETSTAPATEPVSFDPNATAVPGPEVAQFNGEQESTPELEALKQAADQPADTKPFDANEEAHASTSAAAGKDFDPHEAPVVIGDVTNEAIKELRRFDSLPSNVRYFPNGIDHEAAFGGVSSIPAVVIDGDSLGFANMRIFPKTQAALPVVPYRENVPHKDNAETGVAYWDFNPTPSSL